MDSGDSISRLFYAIPSVPEIFTAFRKLKEENLSLTGTRWIPEAKHHITLLFLGEVNSGFIPQLIKLMDDIIESHSDFELHFDAVSLEGGRNNHPSMVWAKFQRHPEFTRLSQNILQGVSELITVTSKFSDPIPHVTLARIHSGQPPQITDVPSFTTRFHGLELWKTIRTPNGVNYQVLGKKYRGN